MKHVLIALLAAIAAFLLAPLLLHERSLPPVRAGSLAARFPVQTKAFQQPAAEDLRWHEKRGHAFSLKDRDESDPTADPLWQRILAGRPKPRPFPGGCLDCHASDGTTTAPYWDARAHLDRSIGCPDCHDPETAVLRLTRPGLPPGASTQEMRTLVCAQCHRDYYLAPGTRFPTGRTVEEIEAFFVASGFRDWEHAETGAAVLIPKHPQFEMHSQGVHARSGVACADCHMPFQRQGALRITAHNARSPLLDLERACLPCHRSTPQEMKARVQAIQQRTDALLARAQIALVALLDDIHSAGAVPPSVLTLQTKAQWRVTFVAADKSRGFHAPQEAARILAEAIDYARQGQVAIARARAR